MNHIEYWEECISVAADEIGLEIHSDHLKQLAEAVMAAHENYGQAFYQPPASDRYHEIEREWQAKYKTLEKQFEKYQSNAETAVKQALNQRPDSQVGIGEYGEVTRYGGRIDRIQ